MKALIIEDELLAQEKIESMLKEIDPKITIVGKISSVKEAVEWLRNNQQPDVAFVDIQLSDDHSFEIFRQVPVQFPVVFTTAYDKYILESFEFNSIDYLLKPITEDKLKRCMVKLKNLQIHFSQGKLDHLLDASREKELERIVVRKGMEYLALNVEQIAYFFTEHRIVFVRGISGKQYIVDKTISELEHALAPKTFFRLNRKFISNIAAIEKFKSDNGKIRVFLKPPVSEEVHVSKEMAPEFRKWIGKTG
jgi:DNA-binding LytR/AlgR family response regulator